MPENNEKLWENAKGAFVPDSKVKPIDKLRNEVVLKGIKRAKVAQQMLAKTKTLMFEEIGDFLDLSAADYGVRLGGKKGNVTLTSYDGQYKIVLQQADHIEFDERLLIAKELVDKCLRDWSADASDNIKALITGAFDVDSKGKLSTAKILGLRKVDITEPDWLKAMEAISDSVTTSFAKSYVRFYERNAVGGYDAISLDIAAVKEVA